MNQPPREPTPAMIAAGHALIQHEWFSPLLRRKIESAGLGVVELWRAMHDAAPKDT